MQAQSVAVSREAVSDSFLVRRLITQAMWPAGESPDEAGAGTRRHGLLAPPGPGDFDHPMDAEDFARCRLLLERMPAIADHFRKVMPNVSVVWGAIVAAWDDLCASLDAECLDWRKPGIEAPNTTAKIRQLIRVAIVDKPSIQDDLLAALGSG